ncbi:MAG: alpha/beta hydrolase [Bacilli bacterium]|nr:alpha/beta hydrolase [Bacilli bacterium]
MYFEYNNISIYYEKYGDSSKSLVILPGWGDTRGTFKYLIEMLKNFYTVYILDYPGFGNSKFPNKDLTVYDYSDLVYEWINYLELDDPVLIGHSFGARLIITLTGYYNYKFSNIIIMDGAGIKPKRTFRSFFRSKLYKVLKRMEILLPKKQQKKYLDYLFNKFASDDYRTLDISMRKTFINVVNEDLTFYLNDIKSKTLLIWGKNDLATPVSDCMKMNKSIENSEVVILDNLGHFPYLNNPMLIFKIIMAELD